MKDFYNLYPPQHLLFNCALSILEIYKNLIPRKYFKTFRYTIKGIYS